MKKLYVSYMKKRKLIIFLLLQISTLGTTNNSPTNQEENHSPSPAKQQPININLFCRSLIIAPGSQTLTSREIPTNEQNANSSNKIMQTITTHSEKQMMLITGIQKTELILTEEETKALVDSKALATPTNKKNRESLLLIEQKIKDLIAKEKHKSSDLSDERTVTQSSLTQEMSEYLKGEHCSLTEEMRKDLAESSLSQEMHEVLLLAIENHQFLVLDEKEAVKEYLNEQYLATLKLTVKNKNNQTSLIKYDELIDGRNANINVTSESNTESHVYFLRFILPLDTIEYTFLGQTTPITTNGPSQDLQRICTMQNMPKNSKDNIFVINNDPIIESDIQHTYSDKPIPTSELNFIAMEILKNIANKTSPSQALVHVSNTRMYSKSTDLLKGEGIYSLQLDEIKRMEENLIKILLLGEFNINKPIDSTKYLIDNLSRLITYQQKKSVIMVDQMNLIQDYGNLDNAIYAIRQGILETTKTIIAFSGSIIGGIIKQSNDPKFKENDIYKKYLSELENYYSEDGLQNTLNQLLDLSLDKKILIVSSDKNLPTLLTAVQVRNYEATERAQKQSKTNTKEDIKAKKENEEKKIIYFLNIGHKNKTTYDENFLEFLFGENGIEKITTDIFKVKLLSHHVKHQIEVIFGMKIDTL